MPKLQIDLDDEVDEAVEMVQIKIKHTSEDEEKPSKKEVVERVLRWLQQEGHLEEAVGVKNDG